MTGRPSRPPIRVLVVEDEPVAADAHAAYVGRVPGFVVVGTARTAADAVRALREPGAVDLVLLDMHCRTGTASTSCGRCARRATPPTCWR